ncbi:S41 family peptidase [Mucilaginibacter sp. CSA2-8R]|uniref:S41 family peptidase n=1 Tax=Mucilaginibacter sp. CSA2-8R TaxID=3141542 RepID=UPI00315D4D3F
MKRLAAIIAFCLAFNATQAQIANAGFETTSDTLATTPQSWKWRPTAGYTVKLTEQEKHAGSKSLQIQSAGAAPGAYQTVSQVIPIQTSVLKRITVMAYLKASDVKSNAQLLAQVFDSRNRILSHQTSQMQQEALSGTNDWKRLTLKLTIDSNAKTLLLGAQLTGTGTVWLDDFATEDLPKINSAPSKDLVKFSREVTAMVKRRSIYADSVNWQAAEQGLQELTASGLTREDSPVILDYMVSRLRLAGDKHSNYKSKTMAQDYATRNSVARQPESKLLPGGVGYISVPAFGSVSDTASVNFASHIQQLIQDLDTRQDVKGWVVDLRRNNGGNMYPMMAGLGPLVGEGTLGGFLYPEIKDSQSSAWTYHQGSFAIGRAKYVTVARPYTLRKPESKIAVLIGAGTASSGEMTTLSFAGKPNARLFGQPTAGYVTTNSQIKLSTGDYLYLAAGYAADRNQKKYMVNIPPDVLVPPGNSQQTDAALEAALKWLND